MLPEVEVKLLVKPNVATFLSQALSDYRLLSHTQAVLGNCYYDSEDHYFSRHKMGLRVRTINQAFELTLKLSGNVTGGLHQRPEYTVALTSPKPDLARFSVFPELTLEQPLAALQASLRAIFSTDFLRQTWTVELGTGAVVEVALDQGEIIAHSKRESISEIEFELKCGTIDELLVFVSQIAAIDGARFGQVSKAERGYQLAGISQVSPDPIVLPQAITLSTLTALLSQELRYIDAILVDGRRCALAELTALYQFWQTSQATITQCIAQQSKVRLENEQIEHFFELNTRILSKLHAIAQLPTDAQQVALDHLFYSHLCMRRHLFLIQLSIG
ncbi:CYTH domain-containing protein [Spirabiliibacterium falconis]|uniref:CYTH domain-containing protein n=1 Tax=Spirabiliibacterium falconis TaxID=572023 RepID=UPI001AAD459A|nr:CYTH domain-containing protein [Spirabiliibacterium falconis]MBE2894011.1 CYTH domain-containing protein [Spirabiliibacterium falconis]